MTLTEFENDTNKQFLANDIITKATSHMAVDTRIDLFKVTEGFALTTRHLKGEDYRDLSKNIFDLNPCGIGFDIEIFATLWDLVNERLVFKSRSISEFIVKNHPEIVDFAPKFDKLLGCVNMQINPRTQKVLVGNGEDVLVDIDDNKVTDLSGFVVGAYINKSDLIIVHRMCLESIPVEQLNRTKLKQLNREYFNDRRIGLYEIEKHLGTKLPSE